MSHARAGRNSRFELAQKRLFLPGLIGRSPRPTWSITVGDSLRNGGRHGEAVVQGVTGVVGGPLFCVFDAAY